MIKVEVFRHIDTLQKYITDNHITKNDIVALDMKTGDTTSDIVFFLAYEENPLGDLNLIEEFLGRNGNQIDNPFWANPTPINTTLN